MTRKIAMTAFILTSLGSVTAFPQTPSAPYPSKPIRIVTSDAAGGNDFIARLIAQGLTAGLGQQGVVDNRPAGVIPGEIVAKARPDGYTLLVYGNNLWVGQFLQHSPYDAVRDFAPISLIGRAPNVLALHPSVQANSVKTLLALAKSRPGELNYASGSIGSSSHLAAELFKHMGGVNIVWIPYKGGGPAMSALIAGQVQLSFGTAAAVAPHTKSGRLRALAATSAQPTLLLPGLPVIAADLPGYESVAFYGLFAPAGTPASLVALLNREIRRMLDGVAVKERLFNAGVDIDGGAPPTFAAAIQSDMIRVGRMVKEAGIRVDGLRPAASPSVPVAR
jgi:tripartite-type tricarboxylate transporter receptor subunit TctC